MFVSTRNSGAEKIIFDCGNLVIVDNSSCLVDETIWSTDRCRLFEFTWNTRDEISDASCVKLCTIERIWSTVVSTVWSTVGM